MPIVIYQLTTMYYSLHTIKCGHINKVKSASADVNITHCGQHVASTGRQTKY